MVSSLLRAVVACVALHVAASAAAQPLDAPNGAAELTLASAIEMALARNPDLIASRYELTAARGRITQAGLRINPELDVELENFAGGGELNGINALETTLSLSQVLELGDKRNLRVGVAEADRDLVGIEQRARELDVLAEVARRFIDVVAAQERLRFAQAATALARQTLEAITERVNAAVAPIAEQSRAQIALTRAGIAQQQSASELRSARYALAALWGDAEPAFAAASADLFRFEAGQTFQSFFERLERTPDFLAFASAARLRDAELRLAQAQARPNIAVGIGIRRLEETNDTALVAGFAMPLAIRDRNQGAIFEARARRAQTDAERRAALTRARAGLFSVYQEMTTARASAETLRGEAVPQAETALSQTQTGYNAGRFSFLELATAQQELLELQEAAIDAAAVHHLMRAELERLTSEPLSNTELEAPLP
jgi:cobalt-zinc-cadmium efflux system outer membrane protein